MSIRFRFIDRLQHSPYGRFRRQLAQMDNIPFDEDAFQKRCMRKAMLFLLGLVLLTIVFFLSRELSLLGLVVVLFFFGRQDLQDKKKMQRMKKETSRAFPGYINNIIIFLQAGYGMEKALEQAAKIGNENRLKDLIKMAFVQISNGNDREASLKKVVLMAQNAYVSKLIFVADQGMRIGKKQVMSSLLLLSEKCMRQELDQMKEDAAKASSKMVFPMMLIFVAIALLALAPGLITLFTSL